MKKMFLLLAIVVMASCNSFKDPKDSNANKETTAGKTTEKLNDTIPYEDSVMLIGRANRQGLEMEEFSNWYRPGYNDYEPKKEVIEKLQPLIKDVKIELFMGTWCEDSHRDVPHLYKILDQLDYNESNMDVYAVSEEKTTPEGFEKDKNIIQVPTIIFYKDGNELGRIVEYSIRTLEEDMYDILSGKDYKNPYSDY